MNTKEFNPSSIQGLTSWYVGERDMWLETTGVPSELVLVHRDEAGNLVYGLRHWLLEVPLDNVRVSLRPIAQR